MKISNFTKKGYKIKLRVKRLILYNLGPKKLKSYSLGIKSETKDIYPYNW